jgi:hypothetical protein
MRSKQPHVRDIHSRTRGAVSPRIRARGHARARHAARRTVSPQRRRLPRGHSRAAASLRRASAVGRALGTAHSGRCAQIKGDALKMGESGSDLLWRGGEWSSYLVRRPNAAEPRGTMLYSLPKYSRASAYCAVLTGARARWWCTAGTLLADAEQQVSLGDPGQAQPHEVSRRLRRFRTVPPPPLCAGTGPHLRRD